ncbi:MAG: hypothetical protein BWY79_00504 [Actinobacteria bacterium ADurb.Bin444]|nr:MAG: hypothetical protein BWY79_00504 [Actinobacteria bacterium ADurb.Bin444]
MEEIATKLREGAAALGIRRYVIRPSAMPDVRLILDALAGG